MKKITAVVVALALAGQVCVAEAAHRAGHHPAKAAHAVKVKGAHQAKVVNKKGAKAHKAKAVKKMASKSHAHRHAR